MCYMFLAALYFGKRKYSLQLFQKFLVLNPVTAELLLGLLQRPLKRLVGLKRLSSVDLVELLSILGAE